MIGFVRGVELLSVKHPPVPQLGGVSFHDVHRVNGRRSTADEGTVRDCGTKRNYSRSNNGSGSRQQSGNPISLGGMTFRIIPHRAFRPAG
jgi:hypothetical protein